MKEPQYAALHAYPRAQLGLMANCRWWDDPRMLMVSMARYVFTADMLAGKAKIAEVGCGDGFYANIINKICHPALLHVYDFDSAWKAECPDMIVHDMLDGPLPHAPYEGIYSLDVMEHIQPECEHAYLHNIAISLQPDGMFIVGMPSLESQPYASAQSREGHVNCKSWSDLRFTLKKHYRNVCLFGMQSASIYTGFLPMAHYLIAICTGPKEYT